MLYDPNWAPPATEIKLEPWQEVLLEAVSLLEQCGWVQHCYGSAFTGYCTIGAVETAAQSLIPGNFRANRDMAFNMVNKAIESRDIVGWNDTPGRRKKDVISLLKKVAANAV